MIRFTDLSAVLPGSSPCGRTNVDRGYRRADQTTKVRGLFIHPEQIAEVIARHPDPVRGSGVGEMADDRMTLLRRARSAAQARGPDRGHGAELTSLRPMSSCSPTMGCRMRTRHRDTRKLD
jgi:phenylacetate-CoA ligase